MDELDLLQLLDAGERVDLECKEAKSEIPKSLWETYSAMANTNGGIILLGIEEKQGKFNISGVNNPNARIRDFWNTINNESKVSKNLLEDADVEILEVESKKVIKITVPRAIYSDRPIFVRDNVLKGTYKRNFEGDYRCTESEIKAMLRDASDEANDSVIFEHYNINDIDEHTLKQYRQRFASFNPDHLWNEYDNENFLLMLGGIREDRGKGIKGLTAAGVLMFGKGHIVRELFPNLNLDYREILGDSYDVRWTDRFTIDGTWENNLYNFYFSVIPRLVQNIKIPFKMEALERKDDTNVHKALREALINTIVHADYNIPGVIQILRKKDQYEFSNPGSLKLDRESIFRGGNSRPRNPKLLLMFRMIGLGENAGSGIPAIMATWKQQHWRAPELSESIELNTVNLKLWTLSLIPNECLEELKQIYGKKFNKLEQNQVLALVTAQLEGSVNNARLQMMSTKHPYDITKMLHGLEEEGYLIVEGYGRGKVYYLNTAFQVARTDSELTPDESKIVKFIEQNEFINNNLARENLGFTKDQNIALFKQLLKKEVIVKEGNGRQTRYIIKQ